MHDAATCARAGASAALLVTEPFERLARSLTLRLGDTRVHVQVLEHPLFTRDDDWIEQRADTLALALASALIPATPSE